MSPTRCTQPGCPGTIVDGYCDVCGMPPSITVAPPGGPASAASPGSAGPRTGYLPHSPAPTAPGSPASGTPAVAERRVDPATLNKREGGRPGAATGRCPMPGCGGEIRDGYCDICGSPPDAAPPPTGDDAAQATPGLAGGSLELGVTALGTARTGSTGTTRRTGRSQRMRTAQIGAGLTRVPPAPAVDPEKAIMVDPVVPENKRSCPSCGTAVGRSRDGRPGRTQGFCPNCRNPFSFDPKLEPGDVVAQQYEVAGCLAHGGLGWIYLARDKNVSDRWVVLKGLLNSGDADAIASAVAEQRFLAQVEHPLIVEIYNFVTHEGAGYIVMEYVGGRSLKQLLQERMNANGGEYDPLPVDQALAYVLEILPAFQYLHDSGLIYCDFKPDNLIQVGDSVKLIDMGGVRRIDDEESAIYGTIGYQAPEVARLGPSVESDIFTIGRTLMVLCSEFRGYQGTYQYTLPAVEDTPLFQENDSLYRLLLRCCAPEPADRFSSVDELRSQLLGVLRETVAKRTRGTALTSAASELFEPPVVLGDSLDWHQLPALRPDNTDPQHGWLSNIDIEDPAERLAALDAAPERTPEVQLFRARAALEIGDLNLLGSIVTAMLSHDPWEWQALWMSGLGSMKSERWAEAQAAFNAVYGQVPGELAPKLALAIACERGDQPEVAEALYLTCVSTDANYVTPSAFGLARIRAARNDLAAAVESLDMVPVTNRWYAESRRLRAQHLVTMGKGLPELATAMDSVRGVRMDDHVRLRFTVEILERALREVHRHGPQRRVLIGDLPATEDQLRLGLERAYRGLAQHEPDRRDDLVDLANRMRKWSLT